MLQFFRRYQKYFFIVVTFVIVISFTFFGTSGSMSGPEKVKDKQIGQLIDGSPLMLQEKEAFVRLLQNGIEEGGRAINLLNDSMVHNEFLLSGLGEILARHYIDDLRPELEASWQRARNYIPYTHPYAPHISAENAWSQFAPQINTLRGEMKQKPSELTEEGVSLLFRLYAAQAKFPPHLLHQMLFYQQGQSDQIQNDPSLPQINVGLFGFRSIEEWFGSKFIDQMSTFILNAAAIASQEGYIISDEEAKSSLITNVFRGLKLYNQGKVPSNEETRSYYAQKLRSIGLTEEKAMKLWKKVLRFRLMFAEVGESVFIDQLALKQFQDFAKPSVKIRHYQLPDQLQFTDFRSMLKFQRYLEIVAKEDFLGLPSEFKAANDIMEEHPQLIQRKYQIEVASVTKTEVAARISFRQTWEWEAKAENFATLQSAFPALADKNSETEEQRFSALEDLPENVHFEVDQFARLALVGSHPEMVDDLLAKKRRESQSLFVRAEGGTGPFSGKKFMDLLDKKDPKLSHFSVDGETIFSIAVIERDEDYAFVPFEKVNQDETMDTLLDDLLLAAYPSLELEEPFDTAKEVVAKTVYADLLKSIQKTVSEEIVDLSQFARHRFDGYLSNVRSKMESEESISLSGPFALVQNEENITEEKLQLEVGQCSEVQNGGFYQLLEKEKIEVSERELAKIKHSLKQDAEKKLMRKLLTQFGEIDGRKS